MDASEVTSRWTAAVSAITARQLVRSDIKSLLLIGAGHLVPFLAEAHTQVRPNSTVKVWARDHEKARWAATRIPGQSGIVAQVALDPASAAHEADVISRTRVFVDTIPGSRAEAGDLIDPISFGIISTRDICADVADLAGGASRHTAGETMVFKAVGTAAADLAVAALAWKNAA